MSKLFLAIFVICTIVSSVQGRCEAIVSAVARAGSSGTWQSYGLTYQVYDVTIFNNASDTCSIQAISLAITSSNTISSSWNWNQTTGVVTLYGTILPPQGSFSGVGVTISGTSSLSVSVSVSSITCDSTCSSTPTSAPTHPTSAPTSPTSAPTRPTSAPTPSSPTSSPSSCPAGVSQYGQNTIQAVAWNGLAGLFFPYTAPPGSSGYGYALQDCQIHFEQMNEANTAAYCEFIYVGNDQPFALAISSGILPGVNTYTYGLGVAQDAATAQATAMRECNCAVASHGLTCSLVNLASS